MPSRGVKAICSGACPHWESQVQELLRAEQSVEGELLESGGFKVVCPGALSEQGLHAQELLRAE